MNELLVSAMAIENLKETLCSIYWYKAQLRSFLNNCISNNQLLSEIDWNQYKRQIVSDIVDTLSSDQEKYLGDIRRLISEVLKMNSFKHLEQLEDGKRKADKARNAVASLRRIVENNDQKLKEEKAIQQKRKESMEKIRSSQAVLIKLDEIKIRYYQLATSKQLQKRGYELEKIMYDIFELFDLDPKASFRNIGEQIDGAFTMAANDFLFEAKWQQYPSNASDLDAFAGKISRKLDNTLGLFLSINGFSEDAVRIHSSGRGTILLMDGTDLMAVLENQIDFSSLIVRKRRHASYTGSIYLKVSEILNE